MNTTLFRTFGFMFIFLFIGGGIDYQSVSAGTIEGSFTQTIDTESDLRVFAYDLHSVYTPGENTALGIYTFYFKSNVPAKSGTLYFYHGKEVAYIKEFKDGEIVTRRDTIYRDKCVGSFTIPDNIIQGRNTTTGEYSFELSKANIPVDATNKNAYLGMTWAIELKADKTIGKFPTEATANLVHQPSHTDPLSDANYDLKSYLPSENDDEHALYYQVREPRLLMVDNNFRCPQGIAIDNNPQSPFFGRVYVANAPTDDETGELSADVYDAGVVVYEPDPKTGTYRKIGEGKKSYMPTGVTFPGTVNENTRFYMHRIAVNPANGNVYYAKSTSSEQSAIYQLIPDATNILTDNGTAINVTSNLISSSDANNPLHPINSLAFGPGGELYVMSKAGIKDSRDVKSVGTGAIYKLLKSEGEDDYLYEDTLRYYMPRTEPQVVKKSQKKIGDPFNINPFVDADNSMIVNARGGFWVTQYRNEIDQYAFLAHIHPKGYIQQKQYGTGLSEYFQFAMGTVVEETFSGNVVTPKWTVHHMLSPHSREQSIEENTYPSGHVAIYEKGGMNSTEAMLAVAFKEKVCIFKLFYNEHYDWFGFNLDWMFEIPIPGALYIDGLAFDYAGNLFVASENTHSLYVFSLPNYGPMLPITQVAVQPMIFDENGNRQLRVTNSNDYTDTYNNLNRGVPLDDNCVVTPARFELKVDGAIVYDKNYNTGTFDTQWSTENNWNIKRVPDATDIPVIVRSDAVLDEKQAASGVTIENNSRLTIANDGGLTVGKDGITGASKSGSSIVIENFSTIHPDKKEQGAGYLRIHPDVVEMPKVTVHYQTKGQPSEAASWTDRDRLWQYVGAPGSGTIARSTTKTWLYKWVEAEGWVKKEDTAPMQPFTEGYAITQEGAPDYWWTAKAINADQEISLSYHATKSDGSDNINKGDNVFVNSYLAPINVAAFEEGDIHQSVERTFYLFNTGSWNEWNNASTSSTEPDGVITQNQSPGQYTAIPTSAAQNFDQSKDPTFIPPMSGVFVRTGWDGATIKLNYERLVWDWDASNTNVNDPMRAPQRVAQAPELLRRIRIQAYGERSGSDRMYIFQDTRCTAEYDNGWDGKNMIATGQVSIYTNEPCGKMEVSASDNIDNMYIGFQASVDTVYTLRFSSLIGDSLYIKDLVADSIIALVDDATYTFKAAPKSVNDMRFQVQLDPEFPAGYPNNDGTITSMEDLASSQVWMSDHIIYIATGQHDNIVMLCNVSGQVLMQHSFDHQTQVSMQGLPAGVYLLKVNDDVYKFVGQEE